MTVKSRLLSILEQNKGMTLSGEKLAEELQCSRTAIWKAVNSLRNEGYPIEAGQNKGYVLGKDSERLSAEALRPFLASSDVFYEVCREVDSTNQRANQLILQEKAEHGSFVLAEQQTAGRGRRGKQFYSPSGAGLYLSVVLKPRGSLRENLLLTAEAAVAVYKAVEKVTGIPLDIKWVNDLYYKNKKVCGILTEAVTDFESGDILWAIVGIGLNLYEEEAGFPPEIKDVAGAVFENRTAASAINRNELAAKIVNALLLETKELRLPSEYIERNIIPGHRIQITEGKTVRYAQALDICPDGRLRIRENDGSETILSYGEVSLKL